ncbi:hypothetical protein ACA910_001529 [Epithemia clementina (nom. ined.)]
MVTSRTSSLSKGSTSDPLSSLFQNFPSYHSVVEGSGSGNTQSTANSSNASSEPPSQISIVENVATTPSIQEQNTIWRWVCLYIFLPTLIFKSCQRATIPVLPIFIRSDLGGTDYQIGLVLASVGLGKLLGNLPSGQFVAVWGSHIGLRVACGILALAWLWAAASCSIPSMFVSSYLEGLGLAMWQVARQNLVTEQIGIHEGRGNVQTTIGGLERFSAIVGPSTGGWLAAQYGLRAPFVVKAFCMVANGLLFWMTHVWGWSGRASFMIEGAVQKAITCDSKETTEKEYTSESQKESDDDDAIAVPLLTAAATATTILRANEQQKQLQQQSSPFLTASIATESSTNRDSVHSFGRNMQTVVKNHGKDLQQIAIWAILLPVARETRTFLFPLKAMDLGYGPHAIGFMTSLTFVLDTALFPLSGYLTDTYGRKYCGVPAGLIMGLSYFLAPIWGNDFWSLTIISALGGIGNGLSGGVLNSVGSDLAPRQHRALFLGTFRIVSDVGILLGPLISGIVAEHLGGTQQAFWVVAFLSVLSSVYMAFVLPETRWQKQNVTANSKLSGNSSSMEEKSWGNNNPTTLASATVDNVTASLFETKQERYGSV